MSSSRTRIIVSDEEEEDEFSQLPPASSSSPCSLQEQRQTRQSRPSRKGNDDEMTTVAPSSSSSSSSSSSRVMNSRSRSLNQSKVQVRHAALEGLRRRSIQGLNALNDSDYDSDHAAEDNSSDSSYNSQGLASASSSSSDDDDDDDEKIAPLFRKGKKSYNAHSRYSRPSARSTTDEAGNSNSKAAGIIASANQQANRRGNHNHNESPRRVDPIDIYTSEEEDMSNFIVDDEEEEQEYELSRKKKKQDSKRRSSNDKRRGKRNYEDVSSDGEEEMVFEGASDMKGWRSSQKRKNRTTETPPFSPNSHSHNHKKKKNTIHDNEGSADDEEEEEEEEEVNVSLSSSRVNKVIVESDEEQFEGVDYDDDDDDDEDDDDDDDDDDEALEGPALYAAVDAMHREREESRAKFTKAHYTRPEAMALYIELLARVHTDQHFLSRNEDMHDPKYLQMLGAQKTLEDTMCVTRESLCSSGAWNKQFVDEMSSRPFCMINEYSDSCDDGTGEKCAACNRKSDRLYFKMFLFGQRYNAPRLWSAARWDKELHPTMYYYARDDQDEYVSDNSEDGSSSDSENDNGRIHGWEGRSMAAKQWKWWSRNVPIALQGGRDTVLPLGATCKTRSTLYHHLLHYKFRLLLKVRDKLHYCGGKVNELMRDTKFLDMETKRYDSLLKQANRKWGGAEQKSAGYGMDVWDDDDGGTGRTAGGSASRSTRTSRRSSGASVDSMRRWLSQNPDADVDQDEVLEEDPIEPADEREEERDRRTSMTMTPSTRQSNASTSAKTKSGSIYDDDDGLNDLEAFGSTCLWERSGATGI